MNGIKEELERIASQPAPASTVDVAAAVAEGRLTEAAPVSGRPAYWTIKPGSAGSDQVPEFRWEYRPRTWALLSVNDRGIADVATVRRIAEEVRFDGGRPLAFPLRATGVPAGLSVGRVALDTRPDLHLACGIPAGTVCW